MPSASVSGATNVPAAGGTLTQDVRVAGEDFLTAVGKLAGAAAAGDISVKVIPYYADRQSDEGNGPTLMPAALAIPASTNDPGVAATLAGGAAVEMVRVRVSGFDRVQVVVTNNNATTALAGEIDVFFD